METKTEVRSYKIDHSCPQCKTGLLRPTGIALLSSPMKYPHECDSCKYAETFTVNYPYIINE